jgi:hypothetical protein
MHKTLPPTNTQTPPSNRNPIALVFFVVIRVVAENFFQFSGQTSLRWGFVEDARVHFARGLDVSTDLAVHAVAAAAVLILGTGLGLVV